MSVESFGRGLRRARRRIRRRRSGGTALGCYRALAAGAAGFTVPLMFTMLASRGRMDDDMVAIFFMVGFFAAFGTFLRHLALRDELRGEVGGSWRRIQLLQERAVLEAAARSGGRVTPAEVAACADDLSIAEARELLDELADERLCTVETVAGGAMVYNFSRSQPAPLEPLRERPASERELRLRRERAVLRTVAEHDGRVTPVLVALGGDDLSIAEARELLDDLARQGLCAVDSDERGALYYDFNIGPQADRLARLSPEEWVAATSARLHGDEPEELSSSTRR